MEQANEKIDILEIIKRFDLYPHEIDEIPNCDYEFDPDSIVDFKGSENFEIDDDFHIPENEEIIADIIKNNNIIFFDENGHKTEKYVINQKFSDYEVEFCMPCGIETLMYMAINANYNIKSANEIVIKYKLPVSINFYFELAEIFISYNQKIAQEFNYKLNVIIKIIDNINFLKQSKGKITLNGTNQKGFIISAEIPNEKIKNNLLKIFENYISIIIRPYCLYYDKTIALNTEYLNRLKKEAQNAQNRTRGYLTKDSNNKKLGYLCYSIQNILDKENIKFSTITKRNCFIYDILASISLLDEEEGYAGEIGREKNNKIKNCIKAFETVLNSKE